MGQASVAAGTDGWVTAHCAFAPWTHKDGTDNTPAFRVVVEDTWQSSYYCHACKRQGAFARLPLHLLQLVAADRREPLKALGKKFSEAENEKQVIDFRGNPDHDIVSDYRPLDPALWELTFPCASQSPDAIGFLWKRRLSVDTGIRLGLRFDPCRDRLLFPVHGGGHLWGYQGRAIRADINPKVWNYCGCQKTKHLLGQETWTGTGPILVVEGPVGYARMHEIGLSSFADICCILGSDLSPQQAAILASTGRAIQLWLDDDKAGHDGIRKAIPLLPYSHVSVPIWSVADIDDLTLDQARAMMEG